ncbi:MAG: tetratricopeptide repeat protein [Candidatus Promineifilaceae bacterium]
MNEVIRCAFLNYPQLEDLDQTAFAKTAFVQDCLLTDDHHCAFAQGYAVQAVLLWMLEQLHVYAPKRYAVLHERYVEKLSVRDYADRHVIGERAAHGRRKRAIAHGGRLLAGSTEKEIRLCKNKMLELRYQDCSIISQQILRFLTIFQEKVPYAYLAEQITDAEMYIPELKQLNLVHLEEGLVGLHPEIGRIFEHHLTMAEKKRWHMQALEYYANLQCWIEAINHGVNIGLWQNSAEMIIQHQDSLLTNTRLDSVLGRFQQHQLTINCWAELQIVKGILAENNHHIDVAVEIYQALLNRSIDSTLHAKIYYRLGRIYRQKEVQASQVYYAAAHSKLKKDTRPTSQRLLAHVYISEAYIYIDNLPNADRVSENLSQAKNILDDNKSQDWLTTYVDWHNAWGNYYGTTFERKQAIHHYWQALQYAQEGGLKPQILKLTLNLGNMHYQLGQYEKAQSYYHTSLKLAEQADDLRMVAMNRKGLGYCLYGKQQFAEAVKQYRAAYDYFQQAEYQFYLASVCFDLTEACLKTQEPLQATTYYQQGFNLACSLGSTQLESQFIQLASQFRELSDELSHRQRIAVNHTRFAGRITKREYRSVTDCGSTTAGRDLNKLMKLQIFRRKGRGGGTYYQMAQGA